MDNIIARVLVEIQEEIAKIFRDGGLCNIGEQSEKVLGILKEGTCRLFTNLIEATDMEIAQARAIRKIDGLWSFSYPLRPSYTGIWITSSPVAAAVAATSAVPGLACALPVSSLPGVLGRMNDPVAPSACLIFWSFLVVLSLFSIDCSFVLFMSECYSFSLQMAALHVHSP